MIRKIKYQLARSIESLRGTNIKFLILLAVVLILIVAIYNKQNAKLYHSSTDSPSNKQLLPSDLTYEERFILTPPDKDASEEAKKAHAQVVSNLAKEAKYLEIKDCKPKPLVLKVKEDMDIEIRNMDSVKHRIIFDSLHYYDIPANGSKTITAQFKYGTGDYGYTCDEMGIVGFLHVTK